MARRLKTFVHVGGNPYGPDDEVPPEVAEQIGEHAWEDDSGEAGDEPTRVGYDDPRTSPTSTGEAPPRSGRGSGIDAWRRFAEQHEVEVAADASREDIIAACEAAGVVEREE
ncbi:hypothetical protein ACIHCX_10695 [Streptomyces sp. NPDC052043]|uniref:hypothetical protein n=1 Tax=Streptomyces sp. NPDC052043 TaxID=3365684 RepID=UPI0037CFD276